MSLLEALANLTEDDLKAATAEVEELETKLASAREVRKLIAAKLVGMRDSIVADQFFASIGDKPL